MIQWFLGIRTTIPFNCNGYCYCYWLRGTSQVHEPLQMCSTCSQWWYPQLRLCRSLTCVLLEVDALGSAQRHAPNAQDHQHHLDWPCGIPTQTGWPHSSSFLGSRVENHALCEFWYTSRRRYRRPWVSGRRMGKVLIHGHVKSHLSHTTDWSDGFTGHRYFFVISEVAVTIPFHNTTWWPKSPGLWSLFNCTLDMT